MNLAQVTGCRRRVVGRLALSSGLDWDQFGGEVVAEGVEAADGVVAGVALICARFVDRKRRMRQLQ